MLVSASGSNEFLQRISKAIEDVKKVQGLSVTLSLCDLEILFDKVKQEVVTCWYCNQPGCPCSACHGWGCTAVPPCPKCGESRKE